MLFFRQLTWVVILGTCLLQMGCKRHQLRKSEVLTPKGGSVTATDSVVNAPPKVVEKLTIEPNEVKFDYLKIKSKVDFTSPTLSQSFPATIQVKKDSIIWVSVSVGLEAARGIITPDSAIFLDRINRNVYRFSFQELSRLLGFDVSFNLVQSVLIGNMPIPIQPTDSISLSNGFYHVQQQVDRLLIENAIDARTKQLHRVSALEPQKESLLQITYSDFRELPETTAPHHVEAVVSSNKNKQEKTTEILIDHTKFEFLDRNLRFPFNVPKGYKEVIVRPKF